MKIGKPTMDITIRGGSRWSAVHDAVIAAAPAWATFECEDAEELRLIRMSINNWRRYSAETRKDGLVLWARIKPTKKEGLSDAR